MWQTDIYRRIHQHLSFLRAIGLATLFHALTPSRAPLRVPRSWTPGPSSRVYRQPRSSAALNSTSETIPIAAGGYLYSPRFGEDREARTMMLLS